MPYGATATGVAPSSNKGRGAEASVSAARAQPEQSGHAYFHILGRADLHVNGRDIPAVPLRTASKHRMKEKM